MEALIPAGSCTFVFVSFCACETTFFLKAKHWPDRPLCTTRRSHGDLVWSPDSSWISYFFLKKKENPLNFKRNPTLCWPQLPSIVHGAGWRLPRREANPWKEAGGSGISNCGKKQLSETSLSPSPGAPGGGRGSSRPAGSRRRS